MALRAFRLRMTAPLHVGDAGFSREGTLTYLPSDSLFSALAVTWRELPKHAWRTDRLAELFDVNTVARTAAPTAAPTMGNAVLATAPPLLVSSAFPYADNVLLLPKPHLGLLPKGSRAGGDEDPADAAEHAGPSSPKAYKRVAWVSTQVFARLCAGMDAQGLDKLWEQAELLQHQSVWLSPAEFRNLDPHLQKDRTLWEIKRVPKVTVDRRRSASALFHVGRTHFAAGCGLWFVAQGETEWLDAVQDALYHLGDSGIGGQRAKGNGQFTPETLPLPPLAWPESDTQATDAPHGDAAAVAAHLVLLSRCAPSQTQMQRLTAPGAAYQLITVGGFNGTPGDNPLIRKQVRMLAEGSVLGVGPTPLGRMVDVTPDSPGVAIDHPIFRYGFGLGVQARVALAEEAA